MSLNILKYIGDSAKRIFTTKDLQDLGATGDQLKSLSGNSVLTFVKDAAHDVEEGLAKFIAGHPTLANEFHLLSDEEAEDEQSVSSPVSEGAGPGSTEPAGSTPSPSDESSSTSAPTSSATEPSASSPAETSTTESAAPAEPSPSTSEVAAPPAS